MLTVSTDHVQYTTHTNIVGLYGWKVFTEYTYSCNAINTLFAMIMVNKPPINFSEPYNCACDLVKNIEHSGIVSITS